jgi:hypothetical protein
MSFTITKNTRTGKQEVLTDKGFKTREWLEINEAEILFFDRKEGTKKVLEFRESCRIKEIRKSIILNYS